jgi:ABC-2 type transport system permease protein
MRAILAIALKDLRNLSRVRSALFFALVWPLAVAIFFGLIFGGDPSENADVPVALVDEDGSPAAATFLAGLEAQSGLRTMRLQRQSALDGVRRSDLVAAVVVPKGFGPASERLFYGEPPAVELIVDPSRRAERAMLEGLLQGQGAKRFQALFDDPAATRRRVAQARAALATAPPGVVAGAPDLDRFLSEVERFTASEGSRGAANEPASPSFAPLTVTISEARREERGAQPPSAFAITFPQGILWGCIGCVMSFAIGLVNERTHGTLVRLRSAPLRPAAILAGKALAAALGLLFVQSLVVSVGVLAFDIRPNSWALCALAAVSVTAAFVGLAMLIAGFGRTEQAVSGAGWALMMPLAMLGGAMVPLIAMPAWMLEASNASPIKWALVAYEGAIWRGFTLQEMALPCLVLLAVGAACFLGGTLLLRRAFHE